MQNFHVKKVKMVEKSDAKFSRKKSENGRKLPSNSGANWRKQRGMDVALLLNPDAAELARDAAEEELARLLALEQRNLAATGGALRAALDAKYVAMRRELAEVMSSVALFYAAGWGAAQLGMALLDAYRVRSVRAAGLAAGPAALLEPELAAVALLGIAIGFERDPSSERPEERSLVLLAERWRAQVQRLQPQRELPLFLELQGRPLAARLRHAQMQVLAALDWRLSVATAGALLDGMLALDVRAADERIVGRAPTAEERRQLQEDAHSFCNLGLLRGFSWFYGQSALAAACVHAARLVYGVEPAWTPALAARCRVANADDVELCVQELVHAYHAQQSRRERECPRTPTRGA